MLRRTFVDCSIDKLRRTPAIAGFSTIRRVP
jgi:hypothetical protein